MMGRQIQLNLTDKKEAKKAKPIAVPKKISKKSVAKKTRAIIKPPKIKRPRGRPRKYQESEAVQIKVRIVKDLEKKPIPIKLEPSEVQFIQVTVFVETAKTLQVVVFRYIRNITIAATILLTLFIGAGVFYTWYFDKHSVAKEQPVASTKDVIAKEIKPRKPANNAPVGVSVTALNTSIKRGEKASVSVRTNAGAICGIVGFADYTRTKRVDLGLKPVVANDFGTAGWGWVVNSSTPVGKLIVQITCANAKKTGVGEVTFTIT